MVPGDISTREDLREVPGEDLGQWRGEDGGELATELPVETLG